MFKKELYRYNSNYQNCKYYSYRLTAKIFPPPFRRAFYKYFGSTSLQSSAIEDFQVAAMFSLYRTMSGTRSRRLPFLSLSLSSVSSVLFSAGRLFHLLQKQWYFNGCVFHVQPRPSQRENSNFIIAGLSGQGQWRSFRGRVCCARNATNLPAFRHREASWFFWLFHSVQMFETDTQKIWFELRLDVVTTYRTNHLAPS